MRRLPAFYRDAGQGLGQTVRQHLADQIAIGRSSPASWVADQSHATVKGGTDQDAAL